MAARGAPVDPELMLDAEQIGVVEIQVVRRPPVGVEVFLLDFELHALRIVVPVRAIIDGNDVAVRRRMCGADGLAQIVGKRGNPAEAR